MLETLVHANCMAEIDTEMRTFLLLPGECCVIGLYSPTWCILFGGGGGEEGQAFAVTRDYTLIDL